MARYDDEVKAKCVEAVKSGKSLTDVSKEFGPNPKAIGRYCEKAGIPIPKKPKKVKEPKADETKEEPTV